MWLKYCNMMHSYNSITFFIYSGCLYFLSTFWCLKVKLIQKVYGVGRASLWLVKMCMARLVFSYHVSLLIVPTSRGWQHFFIWSMAWAVATCSGVYNGRGLAVLPLSKKALRKSHFFPQQSCTAALHLCWISLNADGSSTRPRRSSSSPVLGRSAATGEHKGGACISQHVASPEEIKLPPLKHWPTLTARNVFC